MIDFTSMITWISNAFSPLFGTGFSIGVGLEIFILYLCLKNNAGVLLTGGAVFVATFILASLKLLPSAAYYFLVLLVAIMAAYLIFIKPTK